MKKLIIGGLAILIGVSGFSKFFFTFLGIIAGALPILLILGGALAFYLGYTDIQTEKDDATQYAPCEPQTTPVEPVVEGPVAEITDQEKSSQDILQEPKTDAPPVEEKTTEPTTTEETEPKETVMTSAVPAFKGNPTTLVFHSIDCKFSKGKKCTVDFVSREEAIDQGYKPCKVCKA